MSLCSVAGHLPYLEKHAVFETGKSGQWVDIKGTQDDGTPVLGTHVHQGKGGLLTAYCSNCGVGLIEQFD